MIGRVNPTLKINSIIKIYKFSFPSLHNYIEQRTGFIHGQLSLSWDLNNNTVVVPAPLCNLPKCTLLTKVWYKGSSLLLHFLIEMQTATSGSSIPWHWPDRIRNITRLSSSFDWHYSFMLYALPVLKTKQQKPNKQANQKRKKNTNNKKPKQKIKTKQTKNHTYIPPQKKPQKTRTQ